MVYHGPSTACGACKERRVKCDKGRPACQNCVKRKKTCPGYADVFDRIHRDQNVVVERKFHQEPKLLNGSPSRSSLSPSSAVPIHSESFGNCSRQDLGIVIPTSDQFAMTVKLPAAIPNDYQLSCVDFFVSNYADTINELHISEGLLVKILPVAANAPIHSPVHHAITAVSVAIVHLWASRGLDTHYARTCYGRAVSSLRNAVQDPQQSLSDHVLLSSILLDFYEALRAQFSQQSSLNDTHKLGALALIQRRGQANYQSDIAKSLLLTSRSAMILRSIYKRIPLPASSALWYRHPEIPREPGPDINTLGMEVADFLATVESLISTSSVKCEDSQIEQVLSVGLELDRRFLQWHETLSEEWEYVTLEGSEIPASIRAAGIYNDRCSVYKSLTLAETVNTWRSRRVILLRAVRRCFLTCSEEVQMVFPDILSRVQADIQAMADGICESVPFFIGDATLPLYPPGWKDLTYPKAIHKGRLMPEAGADYHRQACAIGGWYIRTPLLTLLGQVHEKIDKDDLPLRDGQIQWITKQVLRLQTVWNFEILNKEELNFNVD